MLVRLTKSWVFFSDKEISNCTYRGLDGEDIGVSVCSTHGVVIGAVVAQEAVRSLVVDGVGAGHVVTDLPVDIVVGSNESLTNELQVFGRGVSGSTFEDNFTVEEAIVVDDRTGSLLLGTKVERSSLGGGEGKRESCDRELHGRNRR